MTKILDSSEVDAILLASGVDALKFQTSFGDITSKQFKDIERQDYQRHIIPGTKIILIRDAGSSISCASCAMQLQPCTSTDGVYDYEMPCGNPSRGYYAIIDDTPTKVGYVEDTPDQFDFSDTKWKEIKTFIGM